MKTAKVQMNVYCLNCGRRNFVIVNVELDENGGIKRVLEEVICKHCDEVIPTDDLHK